MSSLDFDSMKMPPVVFNVQFSEFGMIGATFLLCSGIHFYLSSFLQNNVIPITQGHL